MSLLGVMHTVRTVMSFCVSLVHSKLFNNYWPIPMTLLWIFIVPERDFWCTPDFYFDATIRTNFPLVHQKYLNLMDSLPWHKILHAPQRINLCMYKEELDTVFPIHSNVSCSPDADIEKFFRLLRFWTHRACALVSLSGWLVHPRCIQEQYWV